MSSLWSTLQTFPSCSVTLIDQIHGVLFFQRMNEKSGKKSKQKAKKDPKDPNAPRRAK